MTLIYNLIAVVIPDSTLLSNTVLKGKVNSSISVEFQSTPGAFKGDALSENLFTVVEAAALIHLRSVLSKVTGLSSTLCSKPPYPNTPVTK